jgi:hypothetical protein
VALKERFISTPSLSEIQKAKEKENQEPNSKCISNIKNRDNS